MRATTRPILIADGSKARPLLVVIQHRGAGGSPDIIIGRDQSSLLRGIGLRIAAGAASPQLTVTELYYLISDPLFGPPTLETEFDLTVDNL